MPGNFDAIGIEYRFASCGESALAVVFGEGIDPIISRRVMALTQSLQDAPLPDVVEVVPTYGSLLVMFDVERVDGTMIVAALRERLATCAQLEHQQPLVTVPVMYEGEACLDLEALAKAKDLTVEAVIALHLEPEYRVYMIGFAPGLAYLGGLPEALHTPRKPAPRQRVPEGAIGIGGAQGSINSVPGPSAWHFIGQTPLRLFEPRRAQPFLLTAGARVRFRRIDREEFATLRATAEAEGENYITEAERT
ncbi:5-oxoprolinase subunit PxpB [Aurantimonas sp. MSK8Z-1]|uniref:5-oxoprolinase subunit PxpB n=1 Tax=Mangrovibrevibacter kandeliae TaxID=2968473 RepID=UPI002118EC12|nr:5-oxoprolinase subunit PxpB [Aurantimonas sp. MSK8Z-1]MCW4114945.1 5-oxoprolinase subunit PxpB [Aurantimonas sp. MSK8Z-1]